MTSDDGERLAYPGPRSIMSSKPTPPPEVPAPATLPVRMDEMEETMQEMARFEAATSLRIDALEARVAELESRGGIHWPNTQFRP